MIRPRKFIIRQTRQAALSATVLCCFLYLLPTCAVLAQSLSTSQIKAEIQKLKDIKYLYIQDRQNEVIKKLKEGSQESVPVLIDVLKKSNDEELKALAAFVIGKIGVEDQKAVPYLVKALNSTNKHLILEVVTALQDIIAEVDITSENKNVVLSIIDLIEKYPNDEEINEAAIKVLININKNAKEAIHTLQEKLKNNGNNSKSVRALAAWALGNIEADNAIPDLIKSLDKNTEPELEVRNNAAMSLGIIGQSLNLKTITQTDLNKYTQDFQKALELLKQSSTGVEKAKIKQIQELVTALEQEQNKRNFLNYLQSPKKLIVLLIVFAYLIFLPGIWLTFLWLQPLWLLKINHLLKPYVDFQLPSALGGIKVTLPTLLLVKFFSYHPRVLDAWVKESIESMRTEFQQKNTVRDRQIYVPIPVSLDKNKTLTELTAKDLRPVFMKNRGCLLIWGEGGAGKTSLACQIARWAMSENPEERLCNHLMLPVLIEQEIDPTSVSGKSSFLEMIRGQLQDLIDIAEPIPEELLERLLRQRCILVIVDRFSEMSEASRKAIRPELPDFPVNALIVTSRVEETLGQVTKATLNPMRIEGNRLSSFMGAYLRCLGKQDLFSDSEFFNACSQLSVLMGQRKITVLLAKMYTEQMIAVKTGSFVTELPDTVPDLMLRYLNELNRDAAIGQPDNRTVQRDTKIIAWESLKHHYHPMRVKRDAVITAMGGDDAVSRLKYLEERLRIIQTIDAAQNLIQFSLDPLAEYLAALQIIELYNQNESEWNQLFIQLDMKENSPESVLSLLFALRDCYLSSCHGVEVPAFVLDELNRRIDSVTSAN